MRLKHFEKTVVGLVRKANEDSIGSLSNVRTNGYGDVFVVCDGMGGHVGGAIASKTAVDCIFQYFQGNPSSNPIIALEKSISFANMQIYAKALHDDSLRGMGTTCTVLLKKDDNIYIAHVGDSRIYINTDNKLYRLTKDHSFVQSLVDAGQLEESEMEKHPRKNELTKALGISQDVDVEIADNPITSKAGDTFLMCSDGLCGLVNDATISQTINTTVEDQRVNDLIQLAENAGGSDNISVTTIDVVESPHKRTSFKDQSNKSKDFTATQVLDVSSMKFDRKRSRNYKKHLIGLAIIIVLLIGYKSYNIFINKDNIQTSEPSKPNNIKLEKSIDKKINPKQTPKKGRYNEPGKVQITPPKKTIKGQNKTKVKKEKRQKEDSSELEGEKISINKILNEIRTVFKGQDMHKGTEEFKSLSKIEQTIKENVDQERWNQIDSLRKIAINKINAFKYIINSRKDKPGEQNDGSNQKENRFPKTSNTKESLLSQGYVQQPYKWDKNNCSITQEIEGEGVFYKYSAKQKAINKLFEIEELKKITFQENFGYIIIITTRADTLSKEKIKIVYDDSNKVGILTASQLEELKKCSKGEYGNKEYYFKSTLNK
jgi:serine/threonine protein phosphatase PrpC